METLRSLRVPARGPKPHAPDVLQKETMATLDTGGGRARVASDDGKAGRGKVARQI